VLARLDPAGRRTFRRIIVEAAVLAVVLAAILGGSLIRGISPATAPVTTPYAGPLLDISVADVTGILAQERLGAFVFTTQPAGSGEARTSGESDASGTIVDLIGPSWNLREIQVLIRTDDGRLGTSQRRDLAVLLALYAPDALAPLEAALAAVSGDGLLAAEVPSGRVMASLAGRLQPGGTLRLTLSVSPDARHQVAPPS
jgi:hypothetical protein